MRYYEAATIVHRDIYPLNPYGSWLGFPQNNGLVRVGGDAVILTPAGKAIIPYMRSLNYLTPRPRG
jgi:hypothetical protein